MRPVQLQGTRGGRKTAAHMAGKQGTRPIIGSRQNMSTWKPASNWCDHLQSDPPFNLVDPIVKSSQVKSSKSSKSSQVKSSQGKSSQVKSSQVKSSQVKSSQVKSSQVKSSQAKSSQVKSSKVKSSQVNFLVHGLLPSIISGCLVPSCCCLLRLDCLFHPSSVGAVPADYVVLPSLVYCSCCS